MGALVAVAAEAKPRGSAATMTAQMCLQTSSY